MFRVLVVDDDFHVAGVHAGIVATTEGFEALDPVSDIRTVPRVLAAKRPDLLLVDLYLPHGSGLEVLAATDVDAFVISAANEPATVRAALRRGALNYLLKPFDPDTLRTALRGYARYRRILDGVDVATPDVLVRARGALVGGASSAGASSAGLATEAKVYGHVAGCAGPVTAVEVAEALGVSRATAQRHLSALVKSGRLTLELNYGFRGRPEHRYARV